MAASCSPRPLWRSPLPDVLGSHGLARSLVLPGSHDVGPSPNLPGSHGLAPRQRALASLQSLTTAGRPEREEGGAVLPATSATPSPTAIDDSRSDYCFLFLSNYKVDDESWSDTPRSKIQFLFCWMCMCVCIVLICLMDGSILVCKMYLQHALDVERIGGVKMVHLMCRALGS
jgi:hypothetical protein